MFHQRRLNGGEVVCRIEHTELTFVGQAFRLGRYPIHFHINGDMSGSYVRGSSIHHSFNRAINIHNSHNILIENNVVYDIVGGAFFLEDGIETGNVFQYNFLAGVKSSTSLLNDDITPAAFWITNPDNIVRHNHVAGGTHFGFWYRMLEHPTGPSATNHICPQKVPLNEYYNNTVHSCGWYGLWVFETYDPTEGGTCQSTVSKAAVFRNLTAWHNKRCAESVECSAIQFIGHVCVANELANIEMFHIHRSNVETLVEDTVIAANFDTPRAASTKRGLVSPLNLGLIVRNVTFINFNKQQNGERDCAAIGTVQIICTCMTRCGGFYVEFSKITWANSDSKAYTEWEFQFNLADLDGTLTGGAPGSHVYHASNLLPPECQIRQDFTLFSDHLAVSCPPRAPGKGATSIRIAITDIFPESLRYKNLIVSTRLVITILCTCMHGICELYILYSCQHIMYMLYVLHLYYW